MNLIPLVKGMKLYCRRMINISGRNYIEAQELPYKQLSLSWRMVLRLYEQRRVVSESDPYFQELMETCGKNNPEFSQTWLKENGIDKPDKEPKPVKSKRQRKSRVQKVQEDKKKAEKKAAEKAEDDRNLNRKKKARRKKGKK